MVNTIQPKSKHINTQLDKIKMNYLHWYDKLFHCFNTHMYELVNMKLNIILSQIGIATKSVMTEQT